MPPQLSTRRILTRLLNLYEGIHDKLARRLGITHPRLNEIHHDARRITPTERRTLRSLHYTWYHTNNAPR